MYRLVARRSHPVPFDRQPARTTGRQAHANASAILVTSKVSGRAYCSQASTGRIRSNWLCSQWRFERRPVAFGTVEWLVQHSWRLLSHGLRRAQIQLNFTTSEPVDETSPRITALASLGPPVLSRRDTSPTQRSAARSAPAKAWAVRPTVEHWGTRLLLEFHSPKSRRRAGLRCAMVSTKRLYGPLERCSFEQEDTVLAVDRRHWLHAHPRHAPTPHISGATPDSAMVNQFLVFVRPYLCQKPL